MFNLCIYLVQKAHYTSAGFNSWNPRSLIETTSRRWYIQLRTFSCFSTTQFFFLYITYPRSLIETTSRRWYIHLRTFSCFSTTQFFFLYITDTLARWMIKCEWSVIISLLIHYMYVRPSFTVYRLSRRNFSWSSYYYSKSLPGYWMVFPAGGATAYNEWQFWALGGITAGDWHILISCYVTLYWLRVKFDKFPSCEVCDVRTHQNENSTFKRNCNIMIVRGFRRRC